MTLKIGGFSKKINSNWYSKLYHIESFKGFINQIISSIGAKTDIRCHMYSKLTCFKYPKLNTKMSDIDVFQVAL